MKKERKIINTNIRLNLMNEQDRQAWNYLRGMDRKKYKSYTKAVVLALNDYFSRQEQIEADPYLETRKKEDEFLNRVEKAVERGARQSMPLVLAGNLLELLKPVMEQLKENRHVQRNFVDKGMCADWAIHDKGDGNPHVHLLLTLRPFEEDHNWGNKETKDWDFVRDESGKIVNDPAHPDWWQDKKNPEHCGIRIPVMDEEGKQKVDSRNRKQWKRVLVDTTGWNNPKNCELWRCMGENL